MKLYYIILQVKRYFVLNNFILCVVKGNVYLKYQNRPSSFLGTNRNRTLNLFKKLIIY